MWLPKGCVLALLLLTACGGEDGSQPEMSGMTADAVQSTEDAVQSANQSVSPNVDCTPRCRTNGKCEATCGVKDGKDIKRWVTYTCCTYPCDGNRTICERDTDFGCNSC
jgi:hypothetical protein